MQALAVFYFRYADFDDGTPEIRLVYETGYLTITDVELCWLTFDRHYAWPKDAAEFIAYMHQCANWQEL